MPKVCARIDGTKAKQIITTKVKAKEARGARERSIIGVENSTKGVRLKDSIVTFLSRRSRVNPSTMFVVTRCVLPEKAPGDRRRPQPGGVHHELVSDQAHPYRAPASWSAAVPCRFGHGIERSPQPGGICILY